MLPIPGYKLTKKIQSDGNTLIYQGQRELDQKSVIVKTTQAEYPTLEQIIRLRHEYKITQNLDIEGIVKPYALETYKNSLALILEDFGGSSLNHLISTQKLELSEFLNIAIQLASTLGALHKINIIHKDIKPQNILINLKTGQIKITDFSISSRLSRENAVASHPNLLEGTLAYVSPEQTGRMNRSIDYRTDFYSLGVTFYEMLTSQLPFQSTDPLELVHCHIAKQPVPPRNLNPDIPQAISDIVIKLLAKTAEDRYQSAYGLKADLEKCLTHLHSTGDLQTEDFVPGKLDLFGQFIIPQKLYGRQQEVATLMDAFDRISAGSTEIMLVSGYSGIGKSSLVNEIHKPIVRQQGYFITGKFDQFKRNIPYVSLIQAFQSLMRQLLTESDEKIKLWKEKILKAVGSNGRVIIDVIPEIELIIGEQPDIPQLEPSESQNRFNRVFQQFIHVFTQPEHPLVLFLDDLQWADSASLQLIQLLIGDPDSQYLLLIGAYRDNEVNPTHPLMLALDEIKKRGARLTIITLQPLPIDQVSQLVADTLHTQTSNSKPLVELVFNKTQGNPFFLTQLLQTLHQEKLLTFDFNASCWKWDIRQIQAIGITDYNVVELIARNIQKLPEETQQVLKLAACIGDRFNLDVLAVVNKKTQSETAIDLWDSLQAGLILPLSDAYKIPLVFDPEDIRNTWNLESSKDSNHFMQQMANSQSLIGYKFLHDRVQQAAYSLIPESQKQQTHLTIGQLLLKHTPSNEIEENIFEIVNQLNVGIELIAAQVERDELARLNLIAGKKAKAATAHEAAVKYLNLGLELLTEDAWQRQYNLTLTLYIETVEAEYLNTNFEQAEVLCKVVLQQATTLLDRVKIYEAQIQFYRSQMKMRQAVDTGFSVLEMLGVRLYPIPADSLPVIELPSLADLENIPVMTDPMQLAAMRLLIAVASPVFFEKPEVFPQLILTMIDLCIKFGHSALAAFAYVWYGILLCVNLEAINAGYHSSQMAFKLLEKFDAKEFKCKVYVLFNVYTNPYKEHGRKTLAGFLEGMQSGLETGDIEHAAYGLMNYCHHVFLVGEPLESALAQQAQYINLTQKLKQDFAIYMSQIWRQLGLNFQGQVRDKFCLIGESFDEVAMMPRLHEDKNYTLLFNIYLAKLIVAYFFKNNALALENARIGEEYAKADLTPLKLSTYKFYYSLALLADYFQADRQIQYMAVVEENQQLLQRWAVHAPANYQHKYDLVEAEKARVLGQFSVAMDYYDRAIQGAKEQGYIHEEAIANELASEFYFSRGRDRLAKDYLIESYYSYIRWGATSKVKDLESRYPQVFSQLMMRTNEEVKEGLTPTSTTGFSLKTLDFATIMKASQTLSGEIVLEKLLKRLMTILTENAGAQTSYFILEKKGRLVIEAAGTEDKNEEFTGSSTPIETSQILPTSVINYVARTKENVVLNDATHEGIFTTDPYILKYQPKSVLCAPIINQGKLVGILYLENNLTKSAFTPELLEVLRLLCCQVAISIENALLYANLSAMTENLKQANEQLEDYSKTLEQKVQARTLELQEKNQRLKKQATQLEQALQKLQATQTQLIQVEKMSSLGQLVAGVAHEINNPINFIYGNIAHANEYIQNLLQLIDLYQRQYPLLTPEIAAKIEAIELEFLSEDLPKLLGSMQVGADRIRQIVLSLRNFSRLDEAEKKPVNVHEGIDSTLLILQYRLKERAGYPSIQVIREYGELPLVECYAGQLNQVLMNILSNAIDALEMGTGHWGLATRQEAFQASIPTIRICTEVIDKNRIVIRIVDNGLGMTEEVRRRLFDPFFTTKPVGSGTGLGLSISYQIVVEKHGGELKCVSSPGQGAEFIIEIPIQQIHC